MSVPSKHRAAYVHAKGEAPKISDRTLGELKPGEIAIKIAATAINPVDWKIRDYGLFLVPNWQYPAILGSDGSGTVAAVGKGVSDYSVGDRVFFQSGYGDDDVSTFQEYIKLPAEIVAKTPKNISDEEASGIMLATMAAATAYYDKTGQGLKAPWNQGGSEVGKGKGIVILGGSSSVGQYAIQLARLSGFERIITNASAIHHDYLQDLGAHVVLDRNASGVKDFQKALEGVSLEFVFDTIAFKETQVLGVEILQATNTQKSRVVVVGPVNEEAKKLGESKEPHVAVQQIMGIALKPELRYLITGLTDSLGGKDGWVAKEEFKPNRVELIEGGLENIQEGLEKNKQGVSGVKISELDVGIRERVMRTMLKDPHTFTWP
ncbi:GroES-like protein [Macroventuria anomochaeta]|uniref:GroES-like protein n=1 Tax=Macroventuria anomochaeta TaxID=301207 RepID=A0ACB6RWF5_9PLEO|nr:GroES-like protein [Macroventuria anomochaeta]KAF2626027.1 GroES-like protein [Macroventuria anomochaeta]